LDLGSRPGGSAHCLGPVSGRETDVPGYGAHVHQAFLAEFAPDFTLGVHFHHVDQFQWFVRGSAQFASHPVNPGVLHFADRHTPYGPLVVCDGNIAFMTLRAASDSGAHFMPGAQRELRAVLAEADHTSRRNLTWDLIATELEPGHWVDVCAEPDGLRVALVELDEATPLPRITMTGSGGYLAVVRGTIRADGRLVAAGGFLPLAKDATSPEAVSGVGGSRVGLFQLPQSAAFHAAEGE
jgi:hypothetical protein